MNKIARFAISIGIAFAVFFGARYATERWNTGGLPQAPETATASDIEEFLKQPSLRAMFQPIAEHFPEEAESLKHVLLDAVRKRASSNEIMLAVQNEVIDIRQSHAPRILEAPDDLLKRLIGTHIAMYEAFDREPLVCNRAIIDGVPSLSLEQKQKIAKAAPDVVPVLIETLAAGKNRPVKRGQLTPAINERFGHELEAKLSPSDLELISSPQLDNERTCGAVIAFYQTIQQAEFSGADVVRADFVKDLMAN